MKKALITCLLIMVLAAIVCTTAFAVAAEGEIQFDPEELSDSVTVSAPNLQKDGVRENGKEYWYTTDTSFNVTIPTEGGRKHYILQVLDEEWTGGSASEQHVVYIDQKQNNSTGSSTMTFTVAPEKFESSKTYYVYTGYEGGSLTKILQYTYETGYLLGDVNLDGVIDAVDSLLVLRAVARYDTLNAVQTAAADTNNDGVVDAVDSLNILRHVARYIDLGDGYVK